MLESSDDESEPAVGRETTNSSVIGWITMLGYLAICGILLYGVS